ncbi:hypothetical protein DW646_13970 [Bacteroides sp. AM23-18]|mgnify:CR=1 FL=1|jgi:hypothetical protein|nr:hypothetical protein DW646_13970 [Bacteroides sp. AM23-18]
MKAKVLKYKSDGNTVIAPYMELEAYAENVYISLSAKNEYGNEDDDCFHVVCKIENVYFSCGQYSRRILGKEGLREEAAGYCRNWIANTLRDAENGSHVSLLSIRVFEGLGLDTDPLLQAREVYRKRQEQRRREEREKEDERRRLEEAKWQQTLDEGKQRFLDGDEITAEIFLEITKRGGFEIHIRTKGTLGRHVKGLNKFGGIRYGRQRGCRIPDFSGCHKAIAAYLKFLEAFSEA